MATVITSECINCGACEPECPNTAIYQGGVEWELDGQMHPALSSDIFFIVPEKCTECVGFFDYEACAAVCPVDCCVPDPKLPESEAVLLERAKKLHPDTTFGPDFPSRFRKEGAAASPPAAAEAPPPPPQAPPAARSTTPQAPAGAAAASGPAAQAPAAAPPSSPASAAARPAAPAAAPKPGAAAAPQPAATAASRSAGARVEAAPEVGGAALPATDEWEIPIFCRECEGEYTVAFHYLRPGVVFYCPHCQASFVPTRTTFLEIATALERFHARWKQAFTAFQESRRRELAAFEERQREELTGFEQRLREFTRGGQRATGAGRRRWFS